MSEKIYACLLRLYPPAFRRRYEEETIQLLRDQLRDESGYFRRLRLVFDLMVDIARSLPQAYRNSYDEATALSPVIHGPDSGQMFQPLHNEPIRRGAFAIAGMLTLTILVAFGYVMELPMPSPAFRANNQSAIESVLERLNRQGSPGSPQSGPSKVPYPAQSASSEAEKGATSPRNAAPSTASSIASRAAPIIAPSQAGRTLEPAKLIPSSSASDSALPGPARTALSAKAEGRQIPQVESGTTSGSSTTKMSSGSQMAAGMPAGLSGRWIEYADADVEFPGGLILVQRGSMLSGFGALGSSKRNPIIHGSVSGRSVRFELSDGRKSFLYDLRVEDEELRGTLTIRNADETRRALVRLRRAE